MMQAYRVEYRRDPAGVAVQVVAGVDDKVHRGIGPELVTAVQDAILARLASIGWTTVEIVSIGHLGPLVVIPPPPPEVGR